MKIKMSALREMIRDSLKKEFIGLEIAVFDFDDTLVGSSWGLEPIPEMMARFRQTISRLGVENVFILTARDDGDHVRNFLNSQGVHDIRIYAVGEGGAQAKADVIRAEVLARGVELVTFYDDLIENIDAVAGLRGELPLTKIVTVQVKRTSV